MTYEFARGLVNFLASEVVQPFAGQVIDCVCPDVGDVLSVAVEYFSVHQITDPAICFGGEQAATYSTQKRSPQWHSNIWKVAPVSETTTVLTCLRLPSQKR